MLINMNLKERSYGISVERGSLKNIAKLINLDRKVLIVTDSGVPAAYSQTVVSQSKQGFVETIEEGEQSKNFENYKTLLKVMVEKSFTRTDCVVAVGGGVVGDLAGFVASSYMRGIDFYNIPTTVLSQIDSSIGGKVAIDFEGYKNIVGAFYQPKKVIIDPDVLITLPKRQISNGLAEAVKMSLTSDAELFSLFETSDILKNIDEIIVKSLIIKKNVVEQDEKEKGLRKILNFGHTIGHGIESEQNGNLYHGECVALGMLPMCSKEVRKRLLAVMKKLNLPCHIDFNKEKVINAVMHDKKFSGNKITAVYVEKIGEHKLFETDADGIFERLCLLEENL